MATYSPPARAGIGAAPLARPPHGIVDSVTRRVSDADIAVFQSIRPRLFGIAYRMLGSASDADDVVQDAWMRWQGTDRNNIRQPAAFLATATTRLAINVTQSARARRETCFDSCLHEPVDTGADPAQGAERGEALELAARMLLEKLSPPERACYVLREAFDYPYRQIATVLDLSEAHARQLVARARTHLASEGRRPVWASEQQRFLAAFLAACRTGDISRLEQVFAVDVVTHRDDGAAVHEAGTPVVEKASATGLLVGAAA
jgi:RNA polymerase sigma factor (sigma-70 family)